MIHQNGRKKLNLKAPHRRALLRNQAIHLINYGHLVSTKARVKETRRFVERVVTIARTGNTFNARRRVQALLPYDVDAVIKLFKDIAPQYVTRPGGYTRIIPLGKRMSDTATVARLEWVKVNYMSKKVSISLDATIEHIKAVLEELRPAILQDGGDIHFVRFDENGTVFVQLHGACVSCPISFITLKMGLETQLKERVPGVKSVISVNDE